ncbi:hypothetical protein F4860DRAFT_492706 [Xylaria cubensis]|nr:hypothetical protein F4860DRAFT_492706 [Xylaria cubensis]
MCGKVNVFFYSRLRECARVLFLDKPGGHEPMGRGVENQKYSSMFLFSLFCSASAYILPWFLSTWFAVQLGLSSGCSTLGFSSLGVVHLIF